MQITTPPHKLVPFVIAALVVAPHSQSNNGPNFTSYDDHGPRSSCYIKVDDPHISEYYLARGERRLKVNARSICKQGHRNVNLTVEIWKEGRFGSNFVGIFSTIPSAKSSSGIRVDLKSASIICKDLRKTKYYAFAYAHATVEGHNRKTPYAVTDHINIECGT